MDRPFEQVLIDERKLYLKLLQRVNAVLEYSWEDCDRDVQVAMEALETAVEDIKKFKRITKVAAIHERRELPRPPSELTRIEDATNRILRKHS